MSRPTEIESGRRTIVAAFGGNSVTRSKERGTYAEQLANVRVMCEEVLPLVRAGHRVVIIHGNGPQVGSLALQTEAGKALGVPDQPFDVLGAMTQGQIGYLIQQTLGNLLREDATKIRGDGGSAPQNAPTVASIVTQVLVDPADPAFQHPTKFIGPFYDRELAQSLAAEKGWTVVQDADRGWRRVVPSPHPIEVIEAAAIRALIAAGSIVVAGGGGGVPVVRETSGCLRGVEAVIDKDLAAEKLAALVGADTLLLITGVHRISLDYGKPNQRFLDVMTLDEARRYQAEGQFPPGSMGPKVEAAIRFLEDGGTEAIVTAAEVLAAALRGTDGTRIVQMPR
ncbi:MAG TPA: carbamate kinase [Candidatus Limnocylindrales bacterium]